MSPLGMSDLVAAMIAAGGPSCTDALDHRHLHAALVRLGEHVSGSTLPPLAGSPDADVGLRVQGVTKALWSLVGAGLLRVQERPGGADLVVDPAEVSEARRVLMRLSEQDRRAVYGAADFWACASTSRKKRPSAATSSAAARLDSAANCRQSAAPARRQRAVSSTSPA
jgi:hypothetical protein